MAPKATTPSFIHEFQLVTTPKEKNTGSVRCLGNTVIVRVQSAVQSGDIVDALVNGEATVKRLFAEKSRVRLQPENSSMKPLNIDRGDFRIIGRVVGVVRRI